VLPAPTGKEGRYVCRPFGTNIIKAGAMWRVEPFLDNGSVNAATDTDTTIELLLETGVFCGGLCGGVTKKITGATNLVLYGKL
jgi:hypothetical protein